MFLSKFGFKKTKLEIKKRNERNRNEATEAGNISMASTRERLNYLLRLKSIFKCKI